MEGFNCHNPYFTGNSFAILSSKYILFVKYRSQSLFYWKLLCNMIKLNWCYNGGSVTILILLETPLQFFIRWTKNQSKTSQSLFYWKLLCNIKICIGGYGNFNVTILILLETPLQSKYITATMCVLMSHNPYFTGNSFAIEIEVYEWDWISQSQSLFYWKLLCN